MPIQVASNQKQNLKLDESCTSNSISEIGKLQLIDEFEMQDSSNFKSLYNAAVPQEVKWYRRV